MAIWSSDPFFDEDMTNPDFWLVDGDLAYACDQLMSWTTRLGYSFVLHGAEFPYEDGLPAGGTAASLEIFDGTTLTATVTSIDVPVAELFRDGMGRFFDAIFGQITRSPQAA